MAYIDFIILYFSYHDAILNKKNVLDLMKLKAVDGGKSCLLYSFNNLCNRKMHVTKIKRPKPLFQNVSKKGQKEAFYISQFF